jgi:hypothetical protein
MGENIKGKVSRLSQVFRKRDNVGKFQETVCRQLMLLKQNQYIDFDEIICVADTESVYTYKDFEKKLRVSAHETLKCDFEEELLIPFENINNFDLEAILLERRKMNWQIPAENRSRTSA